MSLNIKFQKIQKETHTYSDLHLDLAKHKTPRGNRGDFLKSEANNDIKVDYDEYAIRNSLINLFNTSKRQRLLLPDYGLNIKQFLFGNVSENKARIIGRVIREGIAKYEKRVILERLHIKLDAENNSYTIDIYTRIPKLQNRIVTFSGLLTDNGIK